MANPKGIASALICFLSSFSLMYLLFGGKALYLLQNGIKNCHACVVSCFTEKAEKALMGSVL